MGPFVLVLLFIKHLQEGVLYLQSGRQAETAELGIFLDSVPSKYLFLLLLRLQWHELLTLRICNYVKSVSLSDLHLEGFPPIAGAIHLKRLILLRQHLLQRQDFSL